MVVAFTTVGGLFIEAPEILFATAPGVAENIKDTISPSFAELVVGQVKEIEPDDFNIRCCPTIKVFEVAVDVT